MTPPRPPRPAYLTPKATHLPEGHDDSLDPAEAPTAPQERSVAVLDWPAVSAAEGPTGPPDGPLAPPPTDPATRALAPFQWPRSAITPQPGAAGPHVRVGAGIPPFYDDAYLARLEAQVAHPPELEAVGLGDLDPDIAMWPTTQVQRWPFTGPPTTGVWPKGWVGADNTATLWICVVGGQPGTWSAIAPGVPNLNTFTPEQFGAAGNGTTDDTAAIQAALNAAQSVGGTVRCLNNYLISAPLIMQQGVSLIGAIMWPPFFTPQSYGNLICAPTMTTPFIQVPAGLGDFRIEGLCFHPSSGSTTAQPIQVNGTSAQPVSQFMLRNLLASHTGGYSFTYSNRWRAENVLNQGFTDVAGWIIANSTIMRWDWLSFAASGSGTGPTGNWQAGVLIQNSGSIYCTGIATTGTPWYGIWLSGCSSCNFFNTEINGVGSDVIHIDSATPAVQIGDLNFYRLYNNGTAVNGYVISANGLADSFTIIGGNIQITDPAGAATVITQNNAGTILGGIRISSVEWVFAGSPCSPGPYHNITGRVTGINIVNCKHDCFNSSSLTPIAIQDNTTAANAQWNTFVGNWFNVNLGSGMKATVIITSQNAGTGWSIIGNPGLNPLRPAQPAVPANNAVFSNRFGYDCTVYVTGGTVTAIAVGGNATGLTAGTFRVPSRQSITLTYTVAPTWQWNGD